jgi:hypothetical protein
MTSKADTPDEYIASLPEDRIAPMQKLREIISKNIPSGFSEQMGYGMIGYVVPHSLYPAGYHCDPKLPLPFINLASQKNAISLYHMGIYANPNLLEWFLGEYKRVSKAKIDMGKSCIRFKKPDDIPYELIGELASKVTTEQWIEWYESNFKKASK